MTSDERREVAARLRITKAECESRDYPWMVEDLLQAIGFERYEDGEDGIFDRLADLIDPTCQMVECTVDHGSRSWGMRCTACGNEFEHVKPGFGWRFCPNCGARVVDE